MIRFKEFVGERLREIEAKLETVLSNQEKFMADVQTNVAKVEADLAIIKTGIAGLNSQIKALKQSAGTTLSAADAQALDQLATDADNLAASFPAAAPPVVVTDPAPPPPPAGVGG